ncbi:DUF6688 family protein [Pedobacter sp. P26]|uniref:DUF6688 family protein n=1 Tax=Pedobacter sp. P26 TaxID=3423956 RepID=UPI003D66C153
MSLYETQFKKFTGIEDQYGYNLSKKINNERLSNITYLLMKPLESVFLICLYLFTQKPEYRIRKQYLMGKG